MIDVRRADHELQLYVRPQTFPVAIRMLRPGEAIPERARRPARDFKKLSMNCQVIDMARRYGWMIALTREDSICSLGIAALGLEKPTHLHSSGTLCEGMYTETKQAGQRSEAAVDRFTPGEYAGLLVAPLDRATFEPDIVCIYGNPAQVMRLTQAALWKKGGKLTSAFGGRVVCADIIVTTMRTDQPQVILPCSGDRIFGQTQDHEMAFTVPWTQVEEIIDGLQGHARRRHPLSDHAVHGVRGQAAAPLHGSRTACGTWSTARPATRTAIAWWRRTSGRSPTASPSIRSWRRSPAPSTGSRSRSTARTSSKAIPAMMRYFERYEPDVVLAYNDLAKEAEAFGCRVKYSDYVVPSIDQHVLHDDKALLAKLDDARPLQDRAPARLPRTVRGAGEGQAADGDRRGGGRPVDHRDAAAEPGDDAARHVRGPAVHPRLHAGGHGLLARSGATRS